MRSIARNTSRPLVAEYIPERFRIKRDVRGGPSPILTLARRVLYYGFGLNESHSRTDPMDDARTLRRRVRTLRSPYGDVECRWSYRQVRAYRSADTIVVPERPSDEEPVLAAAVETTWVEIQLVDEAGEPVPKARYELKLPDGGVQRGALDYRGRARADGITLPGTCMVRFPDLDADAWEPL